MFIIIIIIVPYCALFCVCVSCIWCGRAVDLCIVRLTRQ